MSRPLRIHGLDHLRLVVKDMNKALTVYQGVLGFEVKDKLHGMRQRPAAFWSS